MANPLSARRILVITKFRFLGDNIWATPFLRRLREAAREARITLLSGPAIPTLLAGCPYVDEIRGHDNYGSRRIMASFALAAKLRGEKFDTVFLLNRSIHSALVAFVARIPNRIGFSTEHRGPFLTVPVRFDWKTPERVNAMELLRAVGADAKPAPTELWVNDEERVAAKQLLVERGYAGGRLIGIQAGAHDPDVREWKPERFAEAADRLGRSMGATAVLLGANEERAVSDRVAGLMKQRPIVLTGETSLRQALGVISQCDLWLGNDGGLLHAASALGLPTVGIFGPTKAPACGYGTTRNRTMVVYPENGSRDRETIRQCLDAITTESVYDAALEAIVAEPDR